ncbi:MAG TPA: D-glucuronyl C5-epimerase family protein [Thermoleophilaceae bacterium]
MPRAFAAAILATLTIAAPAAASPVLVFDNGRVTNEDDPALPAGSASNPIAAAPRECGVTRPAVASAAAFAPTAHASVVSVRKALSRAYRRGDIDRETYSAYGEVYGDAKSAWHRLGGNRKRELAAVITTVNALAARGDLTASRMRPVFLELQRNTEWWSRTSRIPANAPSEGDTHRPRKKTACTTAGRIAAARVQFKGDPLTLQYYPGSGLRLQPLANFGKANALYNACKGINTEPGTPCEPDKLRALLDRLVDTAVRRGGFLAWEYYFWFGGGRPPWVSGIATGSALSALSRGASLFKEIEEQQQPPPAPPAEPTGGSIPIPLPPAPGAVSQTEQQPPARDSAFYLDIARQALPVYSHAAPLGIRASAPRGNHYLIYSFDKGLRVGNAFLESLIGLWDYWQITGDKRARALWIRGDREAKYELPKLDTGAWSLYSLGGPESDLNYHRVIRDFTENLCERTKESAYCSKAARFDKYLHQPARVRIVGPKTARVKKTVRIAIRVDKISCLSIQILRGETVVYQPTWYFPRGVHSFTWTPPHSGTYRVHVLARDLMSRQSRADSDLRVLSRR